MCFEAGVLPKGFVKVRHYGLLANRCRAERLEVNRQLLLVVTAAGEEKVSEVSGTFSAGNKSKMVPDTLSSYTSRTWRSSPFST
jgi:hypothetical protein